MNADEQLGYMRSTLISNWAMLVRILQKTILLCLHDHIILKMLTNCNFIEGMPHFISINWITYQWPILILCLLISLTFWVFCDAVRDLDQHLFMYCGLSPVWCEKTRNILYHFHCKIAATVQTSRSKWKILNRTFFYMSWHAIGHMSWIKAYKP